MNRTQEVRGSIPLSSTEGPSFRAFLAVAESSESDKSLDRYSNGLDGRIEKRSAWSFQRTTYQDYVDKGGAWLRFWVTITTLAWSDWQTSGWFVETQRGCPA